MIRLRRFGTAADLDAQHQAEITTWWRDWHRWLTAHVHLLEARAADGSQPPSFERTDDAWELQRTEAEQTLQRIPPAARVVFERARDARRTDVEAELATRRQGSGVGRDADLDPDALERATLDSLLKQAQGGTGDGEHWGAVPLPGGWYELQVDRLLLAPTAAEYRIAPDDASDRRQRLLLLTALVLVGVVAVWWTWPRGRSGTRAAAAVPALRVNGEPGSPWTIVALTVVDTAGGRTTLPVTATDGVAWPAATTGGVWWDRTHAGTTDLCLPPAVLRTARSLELVSADDAPMRVYALQQVTADSSDLLVRACGGPTPPVVQRGRLEQVVQHAVLPVGAAAVLDANGSRLRMTAIDVTGTDEDAQLPPDRLRLTVHVSAPSNVAWADQVPHLLLQTGQDVIPAAPVVLDGAATTVAIPYLVPTFATPLDAVWSVTDPATGQSLRWRATLRPPRSHADLLRDGLAVTVTGTLDPTAGGVRLSIALRNIGAQRLTLTAEDLTLRQGDRTLISDLLSALGLALAPGDRRTLSGVVTSVDLAQPLTVQLAAARFQVRLR